jgi:hypothetical protein
VVYYAQVEPEIADALRLRGVAENLARLTGTQVERRAEGVMLADSAGRFTDKPFPGRGGAVNRAAGLLLAKIADLIEERGPALARLELPSERQDQADLLARIDSALPLGGVVHELAWSAPAENHYSETNAAPTVGADSSVTPGAAPRATAPLIEHSALTEMIDELYSELGAASFTITWQHDPRGLLAAATAFLADLRLLSLVDGGVLVLPAAARYRNIKLALPVTRSGDAQLAMDFGGADEAKPDEAEVVAT